MIETVQQAEDLSRELERDSRRYPVKLEGRRNA